MSDEPAFDYESLRYIELIGDGNKKPKKGWGGYSQDLDEAERVYTHDEIAMYPDGREWGIVDIEDLKHASVALLIFDVDAHKAPDDFNVSRITLPEDTLVVKSQNGGFHVYFKLTNYQRGDLAESDFSLRAKLPFDIDIRGSAVTHHVVAPSDIPGVGGDYEIVNDDPIKSYTDPRDACERITLDGEPLLEFDPETDVGDFEFDRPSEAPDEMPTCYHAGLELRKAAPDDHPNTHKVNVLTALCGLGAGYSVEEVVDHFVNDYAPEGECDVEETEYQVKHIARHLDNGHYSPPSTKTLRDYGILEDGESCDGDCPVEYHGNSEPSKLDIVEQLEGELDADRPDTTLADAIIGDPKSWVDVDEKVWRVRDTEEYDADEIAAAIDAGDLPGDAQGDLANAMFDGQLPGAVEDAIKEWRDDPSDWSVEVGQSSGGAGSAATSWEQIRQQYADSEIPDRNPRYVAAKKLQAEYDFATPRDSDEILVYQPDAGVFESGGEHEIKRELEAGLGSHYSQHEKREIVGRIKAATSVKRDDMEAGRFDEPLLCVGNGVVNVETRERYDHSPEYLFTKAIPYDHDPEAEAPNLEGFMDDITRREEDKLTMYEMVGHALHPEYIAKKFMVLFGDGDNGKTVFYKFVRELLGGMPNVSGVELHRIADNRFASETILGSYANIAPDMPSKKVSDLGDLKTLTGGEDAYWFEPKGEPGFEAVNTATMMFGCNEPPVLPERTRAVKTRLVPIELPYSFVDDPDPENPLEKQARPRDELNNEVLGDDTEMSGFLNKALDGLERLMENGDVSLPETLDERLELYEQHSDPIKMYAVKCLENETDARVSKDDVYNTYVEFCRENGTKVANRDVFFRKLRQTTIAVSETRGPRPDRKRCLDNLTFTEHGRKVGAGVVFDDVDGVASNDDRGDEDDQPDMNTPLASRDVGRHSFTAEVAAVSAGEYSREAQGTLKGPHGTYIDFVIPGGNENPLEDEQGETFTFEHVKVRTNEDGLLEAVINDAATISEASDGQQAGLDGSATAAATDGGEPDEDEDEVEVEVESDDVDDVEEPTERSSAPLPPEDATGPGPNARRLRAILTESGDSLKKSELFGLAANRFGISPSNAEAALEKGRREGLLTNAGGDIIKSV